MYHKSNDLNNTKIIYHVEKKLTVDHNEWKNNKISKI